MRHTDIERAYPCDGELIELTNQCSETPTVSLCLSCGREFRYEPDSDWVTIVLPGAQRSLDRPT
jgi:hypothetical protein